MGPRAAARGASGFVEVWTVSGKIRRLATVRISPGYSRPLLLDTSRRWIFSGEARWDDCHPLAPGPRADSGRLARFHDSRLDGARSCGGASTDRKAGSMRSGGRERPRPKFGKTCPSMHSRRAILSPDSWRSLQNPRAQITSRPRSKIYPQRGICARLGSRSIRFPPMDVPQRRRSW